MNFLHKTILLILQSILKHRIMKVRKFQPYGQEGLFLLKQIEFLALEQIKFALSDISAINLVPVRRFLHQRPPLGRPFNGFLYLLEGSCTYTSKNQCFQLKPGCLVYLPHYSLHQYVCNSESIRYIRIDYTMTELSSGQELLFSREPMLLFRESPLPVHTLLHRLVREFSNGGFGSAVKCEALLYELFYELMLALRHEMLHQSNIGKILPAIEYIENNYNKEFSAETVAALCGFSPAYFRSLFKSAVGMAPMDYRMKLRMDKACQCLQNQNCIISELAELIGFSNVYYFSRTFRKWVGVPPSQYRRESSSKPLDEERISEGEYPKYLEKASEKANCEG